MQKKNWIVTTAVAVTAASLLIGAGAYAKGQGLGGGGMDNARPDFSELDANGDGKLTMAEMKARAMVRFDAKDTNGDGVLSVDEITAAVAERAGARAGMMSARLLEWRDVDGDGGLSQAELGDMGVEQMFNRADADGDGVVTAEEFEQRAPGAGRGGKGKWGNIGDRQGG